MMRMPQLQRKWRGMVALSVCCTVFLHGSLIHASSLSIDKTEEDGNSSSTASSDASASLPLSTLSNTTTSTTRHLRSPTADLDLDLDLNGRIVGGTKATSSEFPWQVACYLDRYASFSCGASLLSSRWVLTAAHCLRGCEYIAVGLDDRQAVSPAQLIRVAKSFRHPAYGKGFPGNSYDAALLYLESPVSGGETVILGDEPGMCQQGDDVTVSGWGATKEGGMASKLLQKVTVQYIDKQTCSKYYYDRFRKRSRISDDMMCAGTPRGGKDACQGDSGGPIHAKRAVQPSGKEEMVQVGVVSWGYGCADAKYPGVYCRVSKLRQWMEGVMEKEQAGSSQQLKWYSDLKMGGNTHNPPVTTEAPEDDSTSFGDVIEHGGHHGEPIFVGFCKDHYNTRQAHGKPCMDVHALRGRRGFVRECSWAAEERDVRCLDDAALYCCPETCGICSP